MYVRLVRFQFGADAGTKAAALAEELGPLITGQPGCQAVTIFGDESDGECGIYVMWDSQEHADTAADIVQPQLQKHLAGNVTRPPDRRLFKGLWSS